VGLYTAVGYWLDGQLGTRPWLLVAGSVLGTGVGFYLFFKALVAIGRKPPGER
jgi:F0F1-type ATP synthase assembly protein I